MSSVRIPQAKKRLAYERDRYAKGKHDKAFRKGWPIKKRKASHSFRRAAAVLTQTAALNLESDAMLSAIKQHPLGKWPVPSLREVVSRKLEKRERRAARSRRLAKGG